eukprot:4507923-Amphidinium_carterae.1
MRPLGFMRAQGPPLKQLATASPKAARTKKNKIKLQFHLQTYVAGLGPVGGKTFRLKATLLDSVASPTATCG